MDQFEKDFYRDKGYKYPKESDIGTLYVEQYFIAFNEYLKNRLKDEQEKVKQLSEMVLNKS